MRFRSLMISIFRVIYRLALQCATALARGIVTGPFKLFPLFLFCQIIHPEYILWFEKSLFDKVKAKK